MLCCYIDVVLCVGGHDRLYRRCQLVRLAVLEQFVVQLGELPDGNSNSKSNSTAAAAPAAAHPAATAIAMAGEMVRTGE